MQRYIKKYLEGKMSKYSFELTPMHEECRLCIVIPSYDEPDIESTLKSIKSSPLEKDLYEVIVVNNKLVNSSDLIHRNFIRTHEAVKEYSQDLNIFCVNLEFDTAKNAGVGRARKAGMDLALIRFLPIARLDGLIVCLDADCTVATNYLDVLNNFYTLKKGVSAASIYFEHPIDLEGKYSAIYQYELHLRYFIQQQRRIKLPYAYHTVGSSMLVRAEAYAKEGGMNKRHAGEDFYFLHKYTLGQFEEINDTTVYPSPRKSDRVPFGTGRAVSNFDNEIKSYSIESFDQLGKLISGLVTFYSNRMDFDIWLEELNLDPAISKYFSSQKKYFDLCRKNANSLLVFKDHFFTWFNPFKLMKYLHYVRDEIYPNQAILELASRMAPNNTHDLLEYFRERNKTQWRAGLMDKDSNISAS